MITEIKFRCPSCNRKLSVKPEAAGKKIRCPACDAKIQIPEESQIPSSEADAKAHGYTTEEWVGLQKEKELIEKELESLRFKVEAAESLERNHAEIKERYEHQKIKLDEAHERIDDLTALQRKLEKDFQEREHQLERLRDEKKELERAGKESLAIKEAYDSLKEESRAVSKELQAAKNKLAQFEALEHGGGEEAKILQHQCQVLQEKMDQLSSDLNRHVVDLEVSRKHEKELASQLTKYKADKLRDADAKIELEERLQSETDARLALEKQISALQEEQKVLNASREIIEMSLSSVKSERDSLQTKLNELEARAEAESAELSEARAKLETDLNSVKTERDGLQAKLAELKTNTESQSAELLEARAKLEADLNSVKAERDGLQAKLAELKTNAESQSAELLEARAKLEADLNSVKSERDDIRSVLDIIQQEKKDLEAERTRIQSSLTSLQEEQGQLEGDLKKVQTQLNEQRERTQKAEREAEGSFQQLSTTAEQLQKATASMLDMRQENKKLRDQVADLAVNPDDKKAAKALQSRIQELEAKLGGLEPELAKARDQANEAETALHHQNKNQEVGLKKLQEALATRDSELERKTMETERAKMEAQQLQLQINQSREELKALRTQLTEAERGMDAATSLNARLEGLEVEREELLRNNQTLSTKLDQLQSAQAMQSENGALIAEVEELEARKKEIAQDLIQAKSVMMDAANIMGKTKAMQDKIEALSKENARLRHLAGQPGHSSRSASTSAASRNVPSASRTFGKEPGASSVSGEASVPGSESKKLKLKSQSDRPVVSNARGDGKNKFAKSLFGSVRGSKTP